MQQWLMMSPLLAGSRGEWLGDREVRELLEDLEPLEDLELLRDRHLLGSLETWGWREAWAPRKPPSCEEPRDLMYTGRLMLDRCSVLELASSQESLGGGARLMVGGVAMVMVGKEGREAMLMIDLLKPSCTTAGRVGRLMVEEGVRGR